jgi:hypothetical protein
VRLQTAGLIEIGESDAASVRFTELDLTKVPQPALEMLLDSIGNDAKHVIYVEIGLVRPPMYVFNLAGSEQGGVT